MELNYITSDDLIAEVKDELSIWFENGKLDEAYMYSDIRKCLYKMGLKILPIKREVLLVKDYLAKLPKDFHKVTLAMGCFEESQIMEPDVRSPEVIEEVSFCEFGMDDFCGDIILDECGNISKFIVKRKGHYKVIYDRWLPLSMDKVSIYSCADGCYNTNVKSKEIITIANGKIMTNFAEGIIYLEYYSTLETEDTIQIPDNEIIIAWIRGLLVKRGFEKLYYMGEDVVQRLQYANMELSKLEIDAQNLYKRKGISEYYKMANLLQRRYSNIGRQAVATNYKNGYSARIIR